MTDVKKWWIKLPVRILLLPLFLFMLMLIYLSLIFILFIAVIEWVIYDSDIFFGAAKIQITEPIKFLLINQFKYPTNKK